jgi:hypothetical protein
MVSAIANGVARPSIASKSSKAEPFSRQPRRLRAWQLVVTSCLSLD